MTFDGRHDQSGQRATGVQDSNTNGDVANGPVVPEISEDVLEHPGHLTSQGGLPRIMVALPAADKYEAGSLYLALW